MLPITDFRIISLDYISTQDYIVFGFTKPVDVSGYVLYQSSDGINYNVVSIKSDTIMGRPLNTSTVDYPTYTAFDYTLPINLLRGHTYYFKIRAVSKYSEYSVDSSVLTMTTTCTQATSFNSSFDNYQIELAWSANIDTEFDFYELTKYSTKQLTDCTITDTILYNSAFTPGSYIFVLDTIMQSHYAGIVTTSGEFDLSVNKLIICSDISDTISSIYSLNVFIKDTVTSTGNVSTNSYVDSSYTVNNYFMYGIAAVNSAGRKNNQIYTTVYTQEVKNTYPIIRNPDNSSTGILADTVWKSIKSALVGDLFYKKDTWALPYFVDSTYNIRGACSIAKCTVDVFINDIYNHSTSTDSAGEFNFSFQFPKGMTKLTVQLRDKNNIQFSQISQPIYINTINTYSWFYSIGRQFSSVLSNIAYVISGINIKGTTTQQFADNYQPLLELYKDGTEDTSSFQELASDLFNSFEYVGYDKSLESILQAFKDYLADMDYYTIYYNNDLNVTHMVPDVYVAAQLGLPRNIYTYKVTALRTSTGGTEESDGLDCVVDTRHVPTTTTYYNVIKWNSVSRATGYRIYKSQRFQYTSTGIIESSTGFIHHVDSVYNVLADNGSYPSENLYQAPTYNFSTIDELPIVQPVIHLNTSKHDNTQLKKIHYINIIIYMKGSSWINAFNFNRILFYLNKIIPPEKNYTLTICNNNISQIYNAQGDLL